MSHDSLEVRRWTTADEPAVLTLLQASLGWVPDEQYGRFFAWKHRQGPFGESPAWVALDGDRVVGFRTFLRWEFQRGGDGPVVRAVRAVDTATHPDYQGRGVFSRLTLHALDELQAEGVEFVFNTPNDQSRPGYLKLGWQLVGRLPVLARPRSPRSLPRMLGARTPADKWSTPTPSGEEAAAVLAEHQAVATLLATQPEPGPAGLTTRRSPEFLAWRYGFPPLAYRTVLATSSVADGFAVFRLRRGGGALEAALCDVLVPGGNGRRVGDWLLREAVRVSGADYGVLIGTPGPSRAGFLPVPRQGPTLVWRGVGETEMPELGDWRLTLGDVELF